MKPFTQLFKSVVRRCQDKILHINRTINSTVDKLARLAFLPPEQSTSMFEPVCYGSHTEQCSLLEALSDVNFQSARLIATFCC